MYPTMPERRDQMQAYTVTLQVLHATYRQTQLKHVLETIEVLERAQAEHRAMRWEAERYDLQRALNMALQGSLPYSVVTGLEDMLREAAADESLLP